MQIRYETKVGLLIAVAIVLLIVGYSIVSGHNIFSPTHKYYGVYERVDGLNESNPVHLNGYQVGQVESIKIMGPNNQSILVKFSVKKDLEIPQGSIAQIYSADLLGSKAIQLLMEKGGRHHEPGDTLVAEHKLSLSESISEEIDPIKRKTVSLANTIDSLIANISSVLNEGARQDLKKSFASLNRSMRNIEGATRKIDTLVNKERARLQKIFRHTESITENLKNNNEAISNTFSNLSRVSDTLSKVEIQKTVKQAQAALESINEVTRKVNKGEGSLGELVNNKTLYQNLENSSQKLDELVEDLKTNPGRYLQFSVFNIGKGQKSSEKEAPEKED